MAKVVKPKSTRAKVEAHRLRLRKRGLRPIQLWVPDIRAVAFVTAAHQQSQAVARSTLAEADQAFIAAISDWE